MLTTVQYIGVDPDGSHTAVCVLSADGVVELIGGGSRAEGRALCTVTGALELLGRYPGARVAVERQTPGPWSRSCEALSIVHGVWVAACELARAPYTGVLPVQWMHRWNELAPLTEPLRGSRKAYHQRAVQHCPWVANEDQAAALGITAWLAHLNGVRVPLALVDAAA